MMTTLVVVVVVVELLLGLPWLAARAEIEHEGEGSQEDEGGGEDGDQDDGEGRAGCLLAGVEDDRRRDVSSVDVLHLDDVGRVFDQGEVNLLTGDDQGAEDGGVEGKLLVSDQIF